MSRTPILALAALAALAVLPSAAPAATPKPGVFAGKLGAKIPPGAKVRMRAIDRRTAVAIETVPVARTGAFRLSLPPGTYLVVATTVAHNGKVTVSKVGVSLKAGQRRVGATLDRRKNRRKARVRRAAGELRTAWRQERGQVSAGRIAVEIPDLTGTSADPEWNAVRRGINDMLTTDVINGTEKCGGGVDVLEVDRRADILKELEFQQSAYVDPSTRVTRNFIIGDVEVRGTTADAPGGGDVTLRIVDKSSGEELGTLTKRVNNETFFEDIVSLGENLAEELCKLSDVYEVNLDMQGTGRYATHDGSATLRSTIKARRGAGAENAVWRGNATTVWENLSFVSKTDCSYISPVTAEFAWSVEIRLAGKDTLRVTWTQDNLGPGSYPTATVACPGDPPPPPVPGQPGPSLVGALPHTFTVTVAGGSAAVPNGVTLGGDGFFNTGTVRVIPKGSARKR
jgi:hypothetical protein